MFKSLNRRSFLRGAGVAVSLPLLDAMVPAFASDAAIKKRIGFVYVPNGMVMAPKSDLWTPSKIGKGLEMSYTLKPLEKYKDKMTVVSNLLGADGSGQHSGACTAWLTDAFPKKTQGTDVEAGVSIDQIIAKNIGQDTVFPSMELAVEDTTNLVGSCDSGYSCSYMNTISWANSKAPLPMQVNPRIVFEMMFGGQGSVQQRLERMATNRSILDSVMGDINRLNKQVAATDRIRLNDYTDSMREVERRIALMETRTKEFSPVELASPSGVPELFPDHVALMLDLLHIAYQSDLTRVATFMMARELSSIAYPQIGVREQHHGISHHSNNPEFMEKKGKIDQYHVSLFAKFIDKLATTPEGNGTMLDNTMMVYGAGMSNGNEHEKMRIPYAVVSGFVEGDRHIKSENKNRPVGDFLVEVMQAMDVEVETFGRNTDGKTVGLLV